MIASYIFTNHNENLRKLSKDNDFTSQAKLKLHNKLYQNSSSIYLNLIVFFVVITVVLRLGVTQPRLVANLLCSQGCL